MRQLAQGTLAWRRHTQPSLPTLTAPFTNKVRALQRADSFPAHLETSLCVLYEEGTLWNKNGCEHLTKGCIIVHKHKLQRQGARIPGYHTGRCHLLTSEMMATCEKSKISVLSWAMT